MAAMKVVSAVLAGIVLASSAATLATPVATKPAPKRARAADTTPSYAQRADVLAFIEEMRNEHGFDPRELRRVFASAHLQPQIVAAMQRPLLAPPKWFEYVPQFVAPGRVDN